MNNTPLDDLYEVLKTEMLKVDNMINERMFSKQAPIIYNLTDHLINAGGKRLRPLLTLASAKIFDYEGDHHIRLAAVVEFIHTATLLHDDVIDESLQRRGKPTANLLWDNKSSVLVGDYLFSRAFQLMVETKSLTVLSSLSNASAQLSESEILQMSLIKNLQTTSAQYLEVVRGKTATLFSSACEVGGLICAAQPSQIRVLKSFGESLGISFQIVDDYLDYAGKVSKLGKNVGDDFREFKITLPIIESVATGNSKTYEFWKRTLGQGNQNEQDFSKAVQILQKDGSLEKTRLEALHWANKARNELKLLPKGQITDLLSKLTEFIVSRVV